MFMALGKNENKKKQEMSVDRRSKCSVFFLVRDVVTAEKIDDRSERWWNSEDNRYCGLTGY